MQTQQTSKKKQYPAGWILLAIYAVIALLPLFVDSSVGQTIASFPMLINIIYTIFVAVMFFGTKDMLVFYTISFLITMIVENISVIFGIPFGFFVHYQVGPRIGNVPLTVGLGYFFYAMLGWTFADLIVGKLPQKSRWYAILGRPLIGMIVASAVDAIYDPVGSQILGMYAYPYGGGYFGVPLSNSIGWFINVFLILFLFELFAAFKKGGIQNRGVGTTSTWHLQTSILLALQVISPLVSFFVMPDVAVTDGAGKVWSSAAIYETMSLVSLHTMLMFGIVGVLTYLRRKYEETDENGQTE